MFDKLKDMYELQKQASQLKKELNEIIVDAEEESGLVKITMNGEQKIKDLFIAQELINPEKKERLETALKKCFTKAIEKVQMAVAEKMGPIAKNFKLPF